MSLFECLKILQNITVRLIVVFKLVWKAKEVVDKKKKRIYKYVVFAGLGFRVAEGISPYSVTSYALTYFTAIPSAEEWTCSGFHWIEWSGSLTVFLSAFMELSSMALCETASTGNFLFCYFWTVPSSFLAENKIHNLCSYTRRLTILS